MSLFFRKAEKKVLLLMAGPLRPNPPSSLMAVEILELWKKKVPKKFQKDFFFCGFP